MTAMVGTDLRVPRGSWLPVVCCALLSAATLVGGCARVVTGQARVGDLEPRPVRAIPVADLLIDPARFPARYPAAVLPPKDVDRVLGEIDGVAPGFEVTPPECAPLPVLAEQKAAAQGIDDESGDRLVVTVLRPVASVRARVAQLADCPSFTSASSADAGDESAVTVNLPPAPVVDADDSYAVDQTVTSQSAEATNTRTLTLVALVDDVQVTASWRGNAASGDPPDTTALDTLFTDAVLKVRREIPR
jgi:hypothetical protein